MKDSSYRPTVWALALANTFFVLTPFLLFFNDSLIEAHIISLFIVLLINQMYACTLAIIKTLEIENVS